MVYYWMPTVIDLYAEPPNKSLEEIASILNRARKGEQLSEDLILDIASVVNNSLVGASKLLHFVSPSNYAIWDSKIYAFVHGKKLIIIVLTTRNITSTI